MKQQVRDGEAVSLHRFGVRLCGQLRGWAHWRDLLFVRAKVAPLTCQLQPLAALRGADEDTRALWAEATRSGLTFDTAVKGCEPKVAALWLFASASDVRAAHDVVDVEQSEAPASSKRKRATEQALQIAATASDGWKALVSTLE